MSCNKLTWVSKEVITKEALNNIEEGIYELSMQLNIDYDSLIAFDTTEIIRRLNYVDSNNNIILDDDLPAGTYTLKYEFEDGTYADIKNFTIENETTEDETIVINLMEEGEVLFNKRWSRSGGAIKDELGTLCVGYPIDVDGNTECTLIINNMPLSLVFYKDYNTQYFLNADKTVTSDVNNGNGYFGYMTEGWTTSADEKSGTCVFTPSADMKFMYLNLHIKHVDDDLTITEKDIPNLNITLIMEATN